MRRLRSSAMSVAGGARSTTLFASSFTSSDTGTSSSDMPNSWLLVTTGKDSVYQTRGAFRQALPHATFGSTEPEQLVHGCLVGRREREAIELVARDPTKIVDVGRLELPRDDAAFVEVEIDDIMLVGVAHERDELPHFDLDTEPVTHFAPEGVGVTLARLHFAAWKLPQERKDRGGAALGDEIAATLGDDRGDDSNRWTRGRHGAA